jgi:SAM-dependent methyltransferase
MSIETEDDRARRHRQRVLFDTVADLYDSSRRGYAGEILDLMATTAGVGPGDPVLEIGCGTGQLTEALVALGSSLTSIDIGPAMVEAARRRVGAAAATFEVVPFEELDAAVDSFALIASGTAFHWVDPEVGWTRTADLLRPGGWLALLTTGEKYEDAVGAALVDLWISHSGDDPFPRSKPAAFGDAMAASGLYAPVLERTVAEPITLPADIVHGVEMTRATSLSFRPDVRQHFSDELRDRLAATPEVRLEQVTTLTMAQVLPR